MMQGRKLMHTICGSWQVSVALTCLILWGCGSESESASDLVTPTDGQTTDVVDSGPQSDTAGGDSSVSDSGPSQDAGADLTVVDAPSDAVQDVTTPADNGTQDSSADLSETADGSPTDLVVVADVVQDVPADVPPPNPNLWLVSIDNGTHTLQRIDVTTGASTDLCVLDSTAAYPSLTFSRSNRLFASRGGMSLDEINPCTCEVTEIGSYSGWSGVYGITSDQGFQLYGVATGQDATITINTASGEGTLLGYLGVDYTSSGATWSDANNKLFAINSYNDTLCEIDPNTGISTELADLSLSFGTVGIELHPSNNIIYACTDDAHLRSVNPITGEVTVIGDMNQTGSCTNLAAPWYDIPCISPQNAP